MRGTEAEALELSKLTSLAQVPHEYQCPPLLADSPRTPPVGAFYSAQSFHFFSTRYRCTRQYQTRPHDVLSLATSRKVVDSGFLIHVNIRSTLHLYDPSSTSLTTRPHAHSLTYTLIKPTPFIIHLINKSNPNQSRPHGNLSPLSLILLDPASHSFQKISTPYLSPPVVINHNIIFSFHSRHNRHVQHPGREYNPPPPQARRHRLPPHRAPSRARIAPRI